MRFILTLFAFVLSQSAFATADTTRVNVLAYGSTNVTTAAYVTLVASTPLTVSHFELCDTSTKLLKIAKGAAGSEVDLFTVQPSGCIVVPYYLVAGTRLSIKAIDASATTGFNVVTFLNN